MVQPQDDPGIDVVNAPEDLLHDLYHALLRGPWGVTLLIIAGLVLAVNLLFGTIFWLAGGVANARPGSFALFRDRAPALGRGWQVLHPIGPDSPLQGATAESVRGQDMEITVSVTGIDDLTDRAFPANLIHCP